MRCLYTSIVLNECRVHSSTKFGWGTCCIAITQKGVSRCSAFSSKFRHWRNHRRMASIALRQASSMNFDCRNLLHQRPTKREQSVFRRTDFTVKTVLWPLVNVSEIVVPCTVTICYSAFWLQGDRCYAHTPMDGLKTSKAMPAIVGLDSLSGFCKIFVCGSDTVACLIFCPAWGETRRNRSPTSRVRPQWVNHPPRRSQSPSTAPLGARGECPAACLVGHQRDMVSLGLVQGCFKMYWGLFRVGFRVGLRFLQGFLMVCFRVCLGLT